MCPEFNVDSSKLELLGIVNVDGEEAYEIKWSESKTNYYSINSFLKIKSVEIIESPEGTISNESFYTDYKEFGKNIGFQIIESGPLVRSSYRADEQARAIFNKHE